MRIEIIDARPAEPVHIIWGPIAAMFIAVAGFLGNLAPRLPGCIFHQITGYPCPTCGGTRSLIALSRFDLVSSLMYNPLVPLFAFGLMVFSLFFLIGAITGRSLKITVSERGKRIIRYSAIALVVINWVFLIAAGR